MPRWVRPLRWAVVACALAIASHANTLHNPFVFDDRSEIVENPSIRDLADLGSVLRYSPTRPLVNLSYAIDYASSGLNPFGYHRTNVLLHTVNVLLVFVLTWRLARRLHGTTAPPATSTVTAFTAAGLFAVHPVMTEAAGYISSRSEVLGAALFLASLLVLTSALEASEAPPQTAGGSTLGSASLAGSVFLPRSAGRDIFHGRRNLLQLFRWRPSKMSRAQARAVLLTAAGIGLFVLALTARETAATLPFVLLAYDALRRRGRDGRPLRWHLHVPLIALVLLGGAWRVWLYMRVEHPEASGIQWQHLLVQLDVFAKYIALLVVPVGQSLVHAIYPVTSPFDQRVLTAVLVLALVIGTAVAWRRRLPLVAFGVIWFFVVQLPAAALMFLADRAQPMAEHRIYLASTGFFMAAGALAGYVARPAFLAGRRKRVAAAAGLALILATLMAMTVARNRLWADPVLLWEDAARNAPRTFIAHYGVGDAYAAVGDCESAAPAYARALALGPDDRRSYLALAQCLGELGRPEDARRVIREGIPRMPHDIDLRLALAGLEEAAGRPVEALRLCRDALALAPESREAQACVARNEGAISPPP